MGDRDLPAAIKEEQVDGAYDSGRCCDIGPGVHERLMMLVKGREAAC